MNMKKTKLYAFYFPNWHVDPFNEKNHGPGWTEWRCTQYATPRFEGHDQPKVPLWGYGDEAKPEVMEQKISAAKEYGIDGFIYCWYWVDGKPFRNRCLEEGFLKAKNSEDIEFSVMLCNHNPIQAHPSPITPPSLTLGDGGMSPASFKQVADYCVEHYFGKSNYTRINGDLLFYIFNLPLFVKQMGGVEAAEEGIRYLREKTQKAGHGRIHLTANFGANILDPENIIDTGCTPEEIKARLTLDSLTCHEMPGMDMSPGPLTREYSEWTKHFTQSYERETAKLDIPLNPCVACGWDTSPRTVQSDIYVNTQNYPFRNIVVGNTPEEFKKVLVDAKSFVESPESNCDFITFHSWNEWTEGCYLEPDKTNGYGFLEAIKEVFNNTEK